MPRSKKIFFISIIAIFGALGVYIGYMTVDKYKTIVNASLGLTVIFLLYINFLSPKEGAKFPIKEAFEFPKDIKYLVYALVLAIIMFWAGVQVLHLFGI
jgi:hypothetical protein